MRRCTGNGSSGPHVGRHLWWGRGLIRPCRVRIDRAPHSRGWGSGCRSPRAAHVDTPMENSIGQNNEDRRINRRSNRRPVEDRLQTDRRQIADKSQTIRRPNRRQIQDKSKTNRRQFEDKSKTKSKTIRRQIEDQTEHVVEPLRCDDRAPIEPT